MQARRGRRTHDDVIGDLCESQVVIHRRSHKVGAVNNPPFQCRVDFTAGEQYRGDTGSSIDVGNDAARVTELFAFKVLERTDGHLGMDQVQVVLDGAYEKHVVTSVSFPGNLISAEFFIPYLPLVWTVHTKGVGGQECGHRNFSWPVDVKAVHALEHTRLDSVEHLKSAHDGAGRECLHLYLALGDVADILSPVFDLIVTNCASIPSRLNLQGDRAGRCMPGKVWHAHCAHRDTCSHCSL